MMSSSSNSLSAKQKDCLRLVAQGRTSKEIAVEMRLSPSTVDTYLKTAISTLGAVNRRDAARKFLILEQSQKLGSQLEQVVEPIGISQTVGEPADEGEAASAPGGNFRLLRPPPVGGAANELGAAKRLLEVLRIACLMSVVVAGLVLFALGAIVVLS